jgi:hypothetical protein
VQLHSLGFDRMPVTKEGDEPGESALTSFHVKAANSVNVGAFAAGRARLLEAGRPLAGSFTVAADEIVDIGHFAPACRESR